MFIFKIITIIFFPIIRFYGVPVLTYLPVAVIGFIIFFGRQRIPKEYLWVAIFPPTYYILHCFFVFLGGKIPLEPKDYFYFTIPIVFFLLIMSLKEQSDNYRVLKIYYYTNLVVVFISKIPLEITQGIVGLYYRYGMGNIVSSHKYIEIIQYRPGGLLLHPAWFGFMTYLLGRYFFLKEKKIFYLWLSLLFIVFSGAKGALFSFFVLESFFYIKAHRSFLIRTFKIFPVAVFAGILMLIVYRTSPYFKNVINIIASDISAGQGWSFYSVTHRLQMFKWVFSDWRCFFLGGGVSTASLKGTIYIDSEFVMRTLQFGIAGYILSISVFVAFYVRAKRLNNSLAVNVGEFLILFMILGSLSTTLMTNMVFVLFSSLIIGSCEREIDMQSIRKMPD